MASPSSDSPDRGEYTVGWICALVTEYTAAQEFLDIEYPGPDSSENCPGDDNHYAHGAIGKHKIVIAVLPKGAYGTCSATKVATNLARSYPNVRVGLMVGIGGGAPTTSRDIRLGDVVVSEPGNGQSGVFQYDFGKLVQGRPYEHTRVLNRPPGVLCTALAGVQTRHQRKGHGLEASINGVLARNPRLRKSYAKPEASTDRLFQSHIIHSETCGDSCDPVPDEDNLVKRHVRGEDGVEEDIQVHYGLIATGNSVMKNAELRDKLAKEKNVLCFEMEAGGLMDSFPCLVIRGICDYSDSHKRKEWQGYAAMAAAAFARDLLAEVNPRNIQSERQLSKVLEEVRKTTTETHAQVIQVASYLDTKAKWDCLDWLSHENFGALHSDIIKNRSQDTGQWFLESDEYQTWLSGDQQTLFCPGIPGAGKTMIMAIVIDDLMSRYYNDRSIGVAFVYYNFRRQESQGLDALLSSLLRQLSSRCSSVPEAVSELYQKHAKSHSRPSCDELSSALHSEISRFRRAFIVVDALDEYIVSGKHNALPTVLSRMQTDSQLNLIATSRHIPEIEAIFEGQPCLEISAKAGDLASYLMEATRRFPPNMQADDKLHLEIRAQLIEICQGMFLLMRLYMDSLSDKTSKRELRDAVKELRRTNVKLDKSDQKHQSSVLNAAYSDVLKRIKAQPPGHCAIALKALTWITFAQEQLSIQRFRGAVCTIVGDRTFDMDNLRSIDTLISMCCGLATVDKKAGIVRLVHYTAQDFLEDYKAQWAPTAHRDITKSCITHLMYDLPDLESNIDNSANQKSNDTDILSVWRDPSGFNSTSLEPIAGDVMRSLRLYSSCHWGHHVAIAEDEVANLKDFLAAEDKVNAAGTCMAHSTDLSQQIPYDPGRNFNTDYSKSRLTFTALHLTAYFGLCDWLSTSFDLARHFEERPDMLAKLAPHRGTDSEPLTPIQFAILRQHVEAVQKLIDLGARVDSQLLSFAAVLGNPKMMDILLKRDADLNGRVVQGDRFIYSMYSAIGPGHREIVRLLLENGADVNARGGRHGTALRYASSCGHRDIVLLLLENGADVNAQDYTHGTALYSASYNGHRETVRLLIENGANVNAQDVRHSTPLQAASCSGHYETVRLLLEEGADVNARSGKFYTALQAASFSGHRETVRLLLEKGADVNARGGRFDTALQAAKRPIWGNKEIVRLLLENGATMDAPRKTLGSSLKLPPL